MTNTLHTQIELAKAANIAPVQAGQCAGDERFEVRAALAANPSAPEAMLRYLAADENRNVREAVLRNPSTPLDVREAAVAGEDGTAIKLAYEKAPARMQRVLEPAVARSTNTGITDVVARARRNARQRAFETMGAALGAEDADLVETW